MQEEENIAISEIDMWDPIHYLPAPSWKKTTPKTKNHGRLEK